MLFGLFLLNRANESCLQGIAGTAIRRAVRSLLSRHFIGLTVSMAIFLSSGCIGPGLRTRLNVAVNIAPDANRNQPVAVDLVEVGDKDLSKDLSKMTAADWFQKRDQIAQDFPKSTSLAIRSWEWVPGEVVPDIKLPTRRSARRILLFAKYATPGPHRAALAPDQSVIVQLSREDMKVGPLEK
jgi:type VI secretion system protein